MSHAQTPGTDPDSSWNYMQIELIPADALIRPMIGPGGLTREQAHTEVEALLQRSAAVHPPFRRLLATWQSGAKDDTVFGGPFTWTIYSYSGADPRPGALEWLEDYATTIRAAGLKNVQLSDPEPR